MAYDEKTAERVRRILSGRRDVVEKKMIGGLSFMVNGSMCCGLTSAGLMVRVGAEARERALAQPHVQPMKFAGRSLAGFVCIDPEGCRTDKALAAWIQRGIDFVSTLPAKRAAAKRPRSKTPRAKASPADAAALDPRFASVVETFAKDRQVMQEKQKGFGSGALKVNGKIFAMMSSKGKFVVKLSKKCVDELVSSGKGERFDPGRGRVMKEWFVAGTGTANWVELAKQACRFVKGLDRTNP